MKYISSTVLFEGGEKVSESILKWINDDHMFEEFDLVELFWESNDCSERELFSKKILFRELQQEIVTLNGKGITEFRVIPLLTEEQLRKVIQYKSEGKIGVIPVESGYKIYITEKNDVNHILNEWYFGSDVEYIDAYWEVFCRLCE